MYFCFGEITKQFQGSGKVVGFLFEPLGCTQILSYIYACICSSLIESLYLHTKLLLAAF